MSYFYLLLCFVKKMVRISSEARRDDVIKQTNEDSADYVKKILIIVSAQVIMIRPICNNCDRAN